MNKYISLSATFFSILRVVILTYLLLGVYAWLFSESTIFLPPAPSYDDSSDITYLNSGDHLLAGLYLHNKRAHFTILYSHGNAVDIGQLHGLFDAFYRHGYSVLAYDYSGYGLSSGRASEQQAYNDIEIAYRFLVEQKNIAPETIISYGHSLGAAIALDLASKHTVGGLVLEAPFVSAFRVLTHIPLYPFDKFSNIDKLENLNTPVYIMHSRDDPVVPFWHSLTLYESLAEPKMNYWLNDAGHHAISASGPDYWRNLDYFLQRLALR